jgi:hypothetical protein
MSVQDAMNCLPSLHEPVHGGVKEGVEKKKLKFETCSVVVFKAKRFRMAT